MTDSENRVQKKMSPDEYAEAFSVIKTISNERQVMEEWLDREVLAKLPAGQPLRFLSVGAGPGDFDANLIARALARQTSRLEYVAVEPSPAFSNRVADLATMEPRVTCQIIPSTYEDAMIEGPFDFILFFHSLYYLADKEAAIARAIELLVPRTGRLVLVHQGWTGVAQIQRHFVPRFNLALNPGSPSELLLDVLDSLETRLRIDHMYSVIWTKLDTTDIFDPSSQVGIALFDFLLNVKPELVSATALEEFRTFVDELSYPHAGRRWMMQPLGAFVVTTNEI